jgi:hypothetical protein
MQKAGSSAVCRNDSGPIVGEASRPIGPDIFSKGRNIMKKISPARLPQRAFDGSYSSQNSKR